MAVSSVGPAAGDAVAADDPGEFGVAAPGGADGEAEGVAAGGRLGPGEHARTIAAASSAAIRQVGLDPVIDGDVRVRSVLDLGGQPQPRAKPNWATRACQGYHSVRMRNDGRW